MSQLEDLLQQCTVKVTLRGGWGTGFFVAPEFILTCAHVVRGAGDRPIEVWWQQTELQATIERSIESHDLALLRITLPTDANPACVYLDEDIRSRDPLYLFGYPDQDFPNGCPVTFNCEGLTGDEPALIKFALGQVRPGMSGSALLNQRTGKVCGIVKFTRDRSIDLGGGAVPAQVILAQFPQLRSLQQQFHQQDQHWGRAVAAMQQTQLDAGDISSTHYHGQGDNVGGDKVGRDKISGDKVDGDKVGGDKIININVITQPTDAPFRYGIPMPKVRLPDNFVPRLDALNAVKDKLLAMDDRTLVVSAISGLGGLGKSVLATAVVLDTEVQTRFPDGILWVTLGQNPDLQTVLGDWIRELDKSRETFSANTLESASRYLHSLLAERRMLLVVDDVWNSAHAEWFRVGGAGCRVLVTTREAVIPGATRYSLDLMSPEESLQLIQGVLGEKWTAAMEQPALEFAKLLGYLPLALKLMALQVARGRKWETLKKAFLQETERLRSLDQPGVRLVELSVDQRRQYSLRACFQLSLERLKLDRPEFFERFVWLGVLPEDVEIQQQMAMTLWNVEDWEAEETLLELYERSFLTSGVVTSGGEPTYRVHDLMHDMAHSLIECPRNASTNNIESTQLGGLGMMQVDAQRQFLERYRKKIGDCCWNKLPNDSYIHRHLTWHMEQADWSEAIHELMAMSDEHGQNAWFEACDRIGQPAIFVEDVARAWRIVEQEYVQGHTRAIVLQCRYALITATLSSLISNLPIGMMAEFVKREFWTVEQAWAYVEQMQDEVRVAKAIQALAPYLTKPLLQMALGKARSMQSRSSQAEVLSALAQVDRAYFAEALTAARTIQDESSRALVLSALAQVDGAYFAEALAAARALRDESSRAWVLSALVQVDGADFAGLLAAARALRDESSRAWVLHALAQVDGAYFAEALAAARTLRDESSQAEVLSALAQVDRVYFAEALAAAKTIQSEFSRAWVLSALAQVDGADFAQLLDAAKTIQSESSQALVLSALAQVDRAYFAEALAAARTIQDESRRASVLRDLTQLDGADFAGLLAAARTIRDESSQAEVLSALAQVDGAYFAEALAAARTIRDESSQAKVLRALAQVNGADFAGLLAAARTIQDESKRAEVLSALAQVDGAYFAEALAAARTIQDESRRASVLRDLTQLDRADFAGLLAAARTIRDEFSRAYMLRDLTQVDGTYFAEALAAAKTIQSESSRASVLRDLAQVDGAYFAEALAAARTIQDESSRAKVLSALAQVNGADFAGLLGAARTIRDESSRALVLSALAQVDGAYFAEALIAARTIQSEYSRARVLSALAQVDGADFAGLLAAARTIQDEYSRAEVLSALAQVNGADFAQLLTAARTLQSESSRASVLRVLAQVNGAYFAEALTAARTIQSEYSRAEVLSALAQVNGADFAQLLDAARTLQSESSRASVLRVLAKLASQDFLPTIWEAILDLAHKPTCAKALSDSLPSFPLATLSYFDWQKSLHTLAYRERSDLMQDLVTLYPAILHLGGETAMRGVVDAMQEICSQWK